MAILDFMRKGRRVERPIVVYALLDAPREPALEAIAAAMSAQNHGAGIAVEAPGLRVDGELFGLTLIPMPFPWADLEGPCATAWWWPEAADVVRRATAHVIVAAPGGDGDQYEHHLRATQVVAAVLADTGGLGVYWGGAANVNEAAVFMAHAKNASRDSLPLRLWVDFRIEDQGGRTFLFATTGLSAFGLMELECVAEVQSPDEIAEIDGKMFNVAHYLCDYGPVLLDGNTIGMSPGESILVRHEPSCWPGRGTVIRLYV